MARKVKTGESEEEPAEEIPAMAPRVPGAKPRESVLAKATLDDLKDFSDYLVGNWKQTFLPRVVRMWELDADEECERMTFNGPLLDIDSLATALEAEKGIRVSKTKCSGNCALLIFYDDVKGDHPKGAAGIANSDGIELSTGIPAGGRKRIISILPEHLVT